MVSDKKKGAHNANMRSLIEWVREHYIYSKRAPGFSDLLHSSGVFQNGRAAKGASVICFDEFGPIQVKPQPGSTWWALQNEPVRHRAPYRLLLGVSHFLAAYDVHENVLGMHHKKRKRWMEVLSFFKAIRRRCGTFA